MSGIPLGPFGLTLLVTAAALLVMMAVTFAVALKVGRHAVVDTAWGLGIALVAVVSLLASAGHGQPVRRYLLLAAAVIWGLRLAAYVTWRNHGKGEDPRYRDLLAKAKGNRNLYALRSVYLLQALTLWVACLPIQAGMLERAPAGPVTAVGGVVWLARLRLRVRRRLAAGPVQGRPREPRPDHGPGPMAVHPSPQLFR